MKGRNDMEDNLGCWAILTAIVKQRSSSRIINMPSGSGKIGKPIECQSDYLLLQMDVTDAVK